MPLYYYSLPGAYINGKVFTSTTPWEPKIFFFKLKKKNQKLDFFFYSYNRLVKRLLKIIVHQLLAMQRKLRFSRQK